ncbi:MAG: hypothetical protein ACYC8T_22930, partial [Myxococcaceae bacterium]
MTPFALFFLLIPFPGLTQAMDDPAPGALHPKAESRNLECERLGESEARARYPGVVSEPKPRGSFIT